MFIWVSISLLLIINGNLQNAAPVDTDEDERTECGEWVRSNANTDGEMFVGYVNSTEECLSIYYSNPECYESGASMANIDKTNGYDEDTGIDYYGTCWCQFGDKVKIDDAECCITTWAIDCKDQREEFLTTNVADCTQCISDFSENGGCDCMQNESCDISALIPEGCHTFVNDPECGDKATEYCESDTVSSPEYKSWNCTKCKSTEGYSYCRWNEQFHADGGCLPDVEDGIHVPCGEEQGDSIVDNCGDECQTTGGNQPNNNCVFPFWFKENVYETCITVEDDTPWCSTEVDDNGHHVDGQWGYCGSECPGTSE